jgi:hypothetical protein
MGDIVLLNKWDGGEVDSTQFMWIGKNWRVHCIGFFLGSEFLPFCEIYFEFVFWGHKPHVWLKIAKNHHNCLQYETLVLKISTFISWILPNLTKYT